VRAGPSRSRDIDAGRQNPCRSKPGPSGGPSEARPRSPEPPLGPRRRPGPEDRAPVPCERKEGPLSPLEPGGAPSRTRALGNKGPRPRAVGKGSSARAPRPKATRALGDDAAPLRGAGARDCHEGPSRGPVSRARRATSSFAPASVLPPRLSTHPGIPTHLIRLQPRRAGQLKRWCVRRLGVSKVLIDGAVSSRAALANFSRSLMDRPPSVCAIIGYFSIASSKAGSRRLAFFLVFSATLRQRLE
jgi:hypothetical protein